MYRSRWHHQPEARGRTGTHGPGTAPVRISTHAATAGLVAVLAVLTLFSVTAAVTNARAASVAKESAIVSEWSDQAERALLRQVDLVDELALEPDDELRLEYAEAGAATRAAIQGLRAVARTERDDPVDNWLRLHAQYEFAVEQLLSATASNPRMAESYEDVYVDPYHQALETLIRNQAKE